MESIEIKDKSEFDKARKYVLEMLKSRRIAESVVSETMLIFEALFHEIFSRKENEDAAVTIRGYERLGSVSIRFAFEGGMYAPGKDETDPDSPEAKILHAYSDKIDYSYQLGLNRIRITILNSHINTMLPCGAAVICGILAYLLLHFLGNRNVEESMLSGFVLPLERMFGNAMLMVGAPVTFFSLLKNLTNVYIISERSSYVRMLRRTIIVTSVISVLLAIAAALLTAGIVSQSVSFTAYTTMRVDMTVPGFIVSLVPDNIFAPFQMVSPFPLIIVASIVVIALCSVGKHFDRLKMVVDTCYALLSRILSIIMAVLPFFVFLAILHMLLADGAPAALYLAELTAGVLVSLLLMAVFYWIRLKKSGIKALPFGKKLKPLLAENYLIGSALDAAPYNIRYCSRAFHMDRKKLSLSIPVLAQINLDGNCFIITYVSLILMLASKTTAGWVNIALIALLVFFLSLGAPNQPGSCLIGILIILTYMNALELIPLAIFCEVAFGSLLNLINITGDIVTAAEFDRKEKTGMKMESMGKNMH